LIQAFSKKLSLWYEKHQRKLPWRESHDPYKIWISEVMLQQTTVSAVLAYYRKWLRLFPDVKSLSRAPLQKVLKAWQGLGYYQRAKNMHRAAQVLCDKFGGQIPSDYRELSNLPGFGPYTAAAVSSLAFDKPYPLIEANVRRLLMRLSGLHAEANPKNDRALLRFLEPFLPQKKIGLFNQALMEIGSQVCRPKNPLCLLCPLSEFCRAFKEGTQEIIPKPKKRIFRKVEAVVAIIQRKGKFLIQKRPPQGLLADLWEFPGGKRKQGETLEEALRREVKEELLAEAKEIKFLTRVKHAYTQFQVSLSAYECKLNGKPYLSRDRYRWVSLKGLRRYPLPSGSAKIVEFLSASRRQPQAFEAVTKK